MAKTNIYKQFTFVSGKGQISSPLNLMSGLKTGDALSNQTITQYAIQFIHVLSQHKSADMIQYHKTYNHNFNYRYEMYFVTFRSFNKTKKHEHFNCF